MAYNPFEFQSVAIEQLVSSFKDLWAHAPKDGKPADLVLKAPTGSGKTFMLTHFVDSMLRQPDWQEDVAWVWITFSDELAMQSRDKFDKFLFPNVSNKLLTIDDFKEGRMGRNDILFLNWQKLVSKRASDRKSRRPDDPLLHKEQGFYFEEVVEATHAEGRTFVMIIDESHKNVTAAAWRDVINQFAPRVILQVSATPEKTPDAEELRRHKAAYVVVENKDVVAAGLIKAEVVSQTEDDLNRYEQPDNDELMLDLAIEKRQEIADEWKRIGQNINPLVLIQLPNDEQKLKNTGVKNKEEVVIDYLRKKGVNNERIAIWFDNKKQNLEGISEPDCKVEYLLFKYAAGTGWDCPRAHVLVMYREIQSDTFKTQTIGRILRNPLVGNTLDDYLVLRTGYLYTNYKRNEVAAANVNSIGSNVLKTNVSRISEDRIKHDLASNDFAHKAVADLEKHLPQTDENKQRIASIKNTIATETRKALNAISEIRLDESDTELMQERIRREQNVLHEIVKQQTMITDDKAVNEGIEQHLREILPNTIDAGTYDSDEQFVLDPCLMSDFQQRKVYGDLGKATIFQQSFIMSLQFFFGAKNEISLEQQQELLRRNGVDPDPTLEQDVFVNARFRSDVDDQMNDLGKNIKYEVSDNDVEKSFTFCCYDLLLQTATDKLVTNVARSWGLLKEALRQWKNRTITQYEDIDFYRIFLKDTYKGRGVFRRAIVTALKEYQPKLEEFRAEREAEEWGRHCSAFVIKSKYNYSADDVEVNNNRCVVRPFYRPKEYPGKENEEDFMHFIDAMASVEWWMKNNDSGKDSLGFRYTDTTRGEDRVFHPDWIIKFKDGRIGIFDTKSGQTAASVETADKANELQRRLALLCEQSKLFKYFGGIAVKHAGTWYYNDNPDYSYVGFPNGWKLF